MRAILGCGLAVVLAVAAGAQADDKIDGTKLVGKWQPKDAGGPKGKFVIEFTKDGKAHVTGSVGEKELKFEGTYKLDGNKLLLTMKLDDANEKSMTRTISKLTDTELVSKDEMGKEDTLVKVKAK